MSQEEPAPPQEGAQLEDAQLEAIVPAAQAEEAVFDEDPHLYDDGSGDEGPSEKRMRGKNREYKVIQVFDDRAAFDEWWDTESPKWRVADRHWNSGADTDFYRCVAKKPLVLVKYSLVQRPRWFPASMLPSNGTLYEFFDDVTVALKNGGRHPFMSRATDADEDSDYEPSGEESSEDGGDVDSSGGDLDDVFRLDQK